MNEKWYDYLSSIILNILCGTRFEIQLISFRSKEYWHRIPDSQLYKQDTFNDQKQSKFCFLVQVKSTQVIVIDIWGWKCLMQEQIELYPTTTFCWHVLCCCHNFGLLPKQIENFLEFCNITENQKRKRKHDILFFVSSSITI